MHSVLLSKAILPIWWDFVYFFTIIHHYIVTSVHKKCAGQALDSHSCWLKVLAENVYAEKRVSVRSDFSLGLEEPRQLQWILMSLSVLGDSCCSWWQIGLCLCSPAAARKFVEEGIKTLEGKCNFGSSIHTPIMFLLSSCLFPVVLR